MTHPIPPADVLLADGSIALVRELRPDDGEALHALHERVSQDNLRLRFFTVGRSAAHHYVDHVMAGDTLALVLEEDGRLIALATAEPVEPGTNEVAFLVEDGRHGQGIGSLLLEHLAAAARARGTATFTADVLTENYVMLQVFADAGFTMSRHMDEDVVTVRLDTRTTDTSRAAADARERRAETQSLRPLLYPRSVAVVGARSDGTGVGAGVLRAIRESGFTGSLYVVHPREYTSLCHLPERVDLAVIAVPAERVPETIRDAAAAHVPAAVVISSGFQELGARGTELQHELATLARRHSIRVVGPNCLGVMNTHEDTRLNATFSPCLPPTGDFAVATQSGGVGIVLADLAAELGLGIGSLVSLGNKADVSGNDLLAAWTEDPRVSGAALYLESFGNAPKFARIARTFAERKPLLAVVGGRSDGGRRAGASHTAAAATPAVGVAALFAQAGVIACEGAEDLAETALLLSREPLPKGNRVALVGNAGGMGVLAADVAEEHGLVVPELSARTRDAVAAHVLGTVGTSNPIDAGAAAAPEELAAAVEAVLASGEVDAVLVELVATTQSDPVGTLTALARVREGHPGLPVVVVTHAFAGTAAREAGLTGYRSALAALRALARAARRTAWLAERTPESIVDRDAPPQPTPLAEQLHRRELARELLTTAGPGGWLGGTDISRLLQAPLAPAGGFASGHEEAAALAGTIGFPVVVKVADAAVVHRTERGLVRVGLRTAEEVREAVTSFERELGRPVDVLVQPIVSGVEIAVGLVRDPVFGPLVMVGAGGVATDVLRDRAYLLPPLRRTDIVRALRGLRCWPLLDGFRGAPPVDVDALVEVVAAIARLAEEVPEVAEMDLNPVLVSPHGVALVDVKLRLAEAAPSAEAPRQLRRAR